MEWIQQGSRGDDVLTVQKKLQAMGFDPGPIDGAFGSKTESAVRRFQEKHGLQVDGIVGPQTGGALGILEQEVADTPKDAMADQQRSKAREFSPSAGVDAEKQREEDEAKEAAARGVAATQAMKAADQKAEAEAEAEKEATAVEAMMSGASKPVDDKKVGGGLWGRVFGRNRKRNR